MLSYEEHPEIITLLQCSNKNTNDVGGQQRGQPSAMHYIQGNNPHWAQQMSVGTFSFTYYIKTYFYINFPIEIWPKPYLSYPNAEVGLVFVSY